MKKLIIVFTICIVFAGNSQTAQAQTTNTTKTTTSEKTASAGANKEGLENKLNDQVNKLKDKIASRVSELNLVEKRGLIGVVKEVSANKITVTDPDGKTRFVDVDEITKYTAGASRGTFSLTDITKGTKIAVIGLYNKQSKRLLARFVQLTVDPTYIQGTIASIDKKNFQVTVALPDQKQQLVDIVTTTKISTYNKEEGLVKAGFSALQVGDRVTVMGYPDKKDTNLLVASRLMSLVGLPRNPKIVVQEQPASESAEKTNVSPTPLSSQPATGRTAPATR